MQSQEQMKMRRLTLKSQADDLEAEMNDIRKRLTTQQKESNGIQKALTALDIKLEQKKADRHSLLKSCKVLVDLDAFPRQQMIIEENSHKMVQYLTMIIASVSLQCLA